MSNSYNHQRNHYHNQLVVYHSKLLKMLEVAMIYQYFLIWINVSNDISFQNIGFIILRVFSIWRNSRVFDLGRQIPRPIWCCKSTQLLNNGQSFWHLHRIAGSWMHTFFISPNSKHFKEVVLSLGHSLSLLHFMNLASEMLFLVPPVIKNYVFIKVIISILV